jgi:ParB/RepB/Spo0J family partition protein
MGEQIQIVTEITMINKDNLVKMPYNPRQDIDQKAIKKLEKLIKVHGFQNPLNVWEEVTGSYLILAGNHRYEAGCNLGITDFPCVIYEGTKKQAMMRCISDNKSNEWTDWDKPRLKEILIEIDDGQTELRDTGFDLHEIELMMTELRQDGSKIEDTTGSRECPQCGYKF